jgi:3'-phosphoadenosine 5'-phosphosulfate sulfotransferase (PAPS reductase)/FAD synthetase
MVDGGNSYLRRNINIEPYIDLSIEDDGTHELRRQYLTWGKNYDKDMNRLPETIYSPIKDMTSDHIQAILDGNYAKNNPFYEELFKEELIFRIKDSV